MIYQAHQSPMVNRMICCDIFKYMIGFTLFNYITRGELNIVLVKWDNMNWVLHRLLHFLELLDLHQES